MSMIVYDWERQYVCLVDWVSYERKDGISKLWISEWWSRVYILDIPTGSPSVCMCLVACVCGFIMHWVEGENTLSMTSCSVFVVATKSPDAAFRRINFPMARLGRSIITCVLNPVQPLFLLSQCARKNRSELPMNFSTYGSGLWKYFTSVSVW